MKTILGRFFAANAENESNRVIRKNRVRCMGVFLVGDLRIVDGMVIVILWLHTDDAFILKGV